MGKSIRKCLLGSLICTFVLLLLLFLVVFVIIPIVFKYNADLQKSIILPTWAVEKTNFSDFDSVGLKGARNFYVNVDKDENITLGVWQILPNKLLSSDADNQYYNYEDILTNKEDDILIYLHGNGASRAWAVDLYSLLRDYFHIFAVDYRGYGDSTDAELNENNIVKDIVNFYKWLRGRSRARIFFWGHSLGTGVCTHTVSSLKAENLIPSGVVLEAPFSSVTDVMERHPFVKLLSWLPWQRSTLIDPVIHNGLGFESTKYIVDIDCPIMILHAKDDTIIPYDLAGKLYETAIKNRNLTTQGDVIYHLFEAKGYDHMLIVLAPELPMFVSDFVETCIKFENKTHNSTS